MHTLHCILLFALRASGQLVQPGCCRGTLPHEHQELKGQKELKHLPNVEMRSYYPQAFLALDFCTMETFELQ